MTRLEASAIVVCAVAIVVAIVWLIWSNIAGKRRIPERAESCSICGRFGCTSLQCNRIREKQRRLLAELIEPSEKAIATAADLHWGVGWGKSDHVAMFPGPGRDLLGIGHFTGVFGPGIAVPVNGDPREILVEWVDDELRPRPDTPLTGWLEDWELEPTDIDRGDNPWPAIPIVKLLSGFEHARPWAHG